MKIYVGNRDDRGWVTGVTVVDGDKAYGLEPHLNDFYLSPTGYEWGYGGSGPRQLAYAILRDYLGTDHMLARVGLNDFLEEFILHHPQNEPLRITSDQIAPFVKQHLPMWQKKVDFETSPEREREADHLKSKLARMKAAELERQFRVDTPDHQKIQRAFELPDADSQFESVAQGLLNAVGEADGTSAALGEIPSGVINIVDPTKDEDEDEEKEKVTEALKLLNLYELVHVPIPFKTAEEHAIAKALASEPKLQKKVPLESVKVVDLEPTQWRLDLANVRKLAREKIFNGALVFKRRGRFFIFDGHHRTEAAKKAGVESIRCRVIDMEEDPFTVTKMMNRYNIDKKDLIAAMDSQDRISFEKQA